VNFAKGLLSLCYSDNGKGYNIKDIKTKPGGLGIGNIIQRVNLIDAKILFSRRKGKTEVRISKEI
jgi:signal transduction histidine kinase